jgi:tetratricopeptide (TPR) repeat protein
MDWLKDRAGKVIIIEPSGSTRTMMTEVVRGVGFGDVSGVASVKDAVGLMEVEEINWIVASVCADQPENSLSLLKLVCQRPELRTVRMSLLVDENEEDLLPDAFELGLLSFHPKKSTKDSLVAELNDLMQAAEQVNWDSTLLSATFLRHHLMAVERYDELVEFERRLIKQYPGDIEILFNLVPPLSRQGMKDQAKSTLRQILLISPESEERVEQMSAEYLNGETLRTRESEGVNALGLNNVVVVDSDDSARKAFEDLLKEIGVEHIHLFDNGIEAIDHIGSAESVDMVFMEWRIPKLTGPLLIQRILSSKASSAPIIICSSLVEQEDQPFIREMGVSHMLDKPIDRKNVMQIILWTVQQQLAPTDKFMLEKKIRQALKERDDQKLSEFYDKYMGNEQINLGAKDLIEAEIAFSKARYPEARDRALSSIRHNGDSLFILNLLGKILMNLQEFESALKCFEKAQQMAPHNLERLCRIAEVQSELGEEEKANEALELAEKADAGSQVLAETKAKVAINQGDMDTAKAIMGQLEAMENVVSYLNNQAVALAKCDMLEKSIEQYEKALLAISEDKPEVKAIIYYNTALAHLRGSDAEAAQRSLQDAVQIKGSRVEKKAKILLKKVEKAIQMDIEITLPSQSPANSNEGEEKSTERHEEATSHDQSSSEEASVELSTDAADKSVESEANDTDAVSEADDTGLGASEDETNGAGNSERAVGESAATGVSKPSGNPSKRVKTEAGHEHKFGLLDSMLQTRPGDICCYLIYQANSHSEFALKLLEHVIRFKKREALEREASGGADRVMASAS